MGSWEDGVTVDIKMTSSWSSWEAKARFLRCKPRQFRLSYISTRHYQATFRLSEIGDELWVWRTPAFSVSSPPQSSLWPPSSTSNSIMVDDLGVWLIAKLSKIGKFSEVIGGENTSSFMGSSRLFSMLPSSSIVFRLHVPVEQVLTGWFLCGILGNWKLERSWIWLLLTSVSGSRNNIDLVITDDSWKSLA